MIPFALPNINASVLTVDVTVRTLKELIEVAGSVPFNLPPNLDAIDLNVDGEIRVAFDGNIPTTSKGFKLPAGIYKFRGVNLSQLRLVASTTTAVSIHIGQSVEGEGDVIAVIPSGGGGGGSVNSVTAGDSTITVAGTASDPTVGINLANVNTWTGTQNFNNGATARNATQDTTISTLIASRSSSTAQVRIGHTSSYSGVRIDDPVGSIARFTSAQGSVQIGTDLGNANSSSIIQAGVERFRVTGGTMENMSTGTIGAAQHGYTRTGDNYIHNVTIGGNYQFNVNGVTGFTIQATQVIAPRFLASGFTTSSATAPFRGAAGNSSALFYPGGVMDSTVTEQSNSLTTETTLYNFTVLAQTINRAAGQGIQLKAGGIFATPGAGSRLRVRFDGTELFNSGDLDGLATESWYLDMCIDRGNSANTIIWIAKLYIDGVTPIVQSGSLVVTMTGNVDLTLTAEGTDDDQFFLQLAKVFYDPMA